MATSWYIAMCIYEEIYAYPMNMAAALPECGDRHICADYLEGLIHVVPRHEAGDDARKYCIGGFTIDLYGSLLQARDQQFQRWCWGQILAPPMTR